MDLSINNEITKEKQTNKEITNFMSELSVTLDKKLSNNSNLYNEILRDVELASKYKYRLPNIIDKCLTDLSYERDFFYFDFDKSQKEYCLKYYCKGENVVCDKLDKKDIENLRESGCTFFVSVDDEGTIGACDSLKDWIKYEVDNKLFDIDIKNKKSKG